MATCPVCGNSIDETAARSETGLTAHGASEVDPSKGTRQFYNGKWYYFDTLECRSAFMVKPESYLEQTGA
jgi:YHS domain-containing protein